VKGSLDADVIMSFLGTANVYIGRGEQNYKLDTAGCCYRRGFDLRHILTIPRYSVVA
jgi:hypothetical protein